MLLAFDFTYDETGKRREDLTTFSVPDAYARKIAQMRPDRFEWIASVHPYRRDAIAALEAARAGNARAVPALRELREVNALMFDFVLKRSLGYRGARIPASAFETRGFFERGGA